ncbi:hypothetical protein AB0346_00215 [Nocardia beijingensis]
MRISTGCGDGGCGGDASRGVSGSGAVDCWWAGAGSGEGPARESLTVAP